MTRMEHKYKTGHTIGTLRIIEAGPWTHANPGDSQHKLARRQWWYLAQCGCGSAPHWVYQDQFRTHTACSDCLRKRRFTTGKPEHQRRKPPVDFARLRW